jgi:hypothetical protein
MLVVCSGHRRRPACLRAVAMGLDIELMKICKAWRFARLRFARLRCSHRSRDSGSLLPPALRGRRAGDEGAQRASAQRTLQAARRLAIAQ